METISKYQVRWAIIDTYSRKKVFKYQKKALAQIGFSVMERADCAPEIVKHYRDEDAVIADIANIRHAYHIINSKRPSAIIGTIITDAQFGMVQPGESTIIRSTERQRDMFRAMVGIPNHPWSDFQPEMYNQTERI